MTTVFNSSQRGNMPQIICFVCGSKGGSHVLHIKPRDKGAYFPFLEHHDPPKGCRPPTNGTIQACGVCYAFLIGQWDSFERTKTPAIKRLYWLKRCDDGQFTGAEMRIQGEYAAQVMGLQYTPGSFGGASGGTSDYNGIPPSPVPSTPHSLSPVKPSRHPSPKKFKFEQEPSGGVLDLSITSPIKSKPSGSSKRPRHADVSKEVENIPIKDGQTIICYLCGSEQPMSLGRYVFSKKSVEGEPFFPFLEHIRPPKGAMPLTPQGLTRVCSNCRTTLSRQWKAYDATSTPEQERMYRINNQPVSIFPKTAAQEPKQRSAEAHPAELDFQEICYLCGQVYHKDSMKLLYTRPPRENSKHSMYFPFVENLQRHSKAKGIDSEGRVPSCRACYSYLQRQWQTYQNDGTPAKNRKFVLRPLTGKDVDEGANHVASTTEKKTPKEEDGEVNQPLNIQISSTNSMFSVPAPGLLAIAPGVSPQMMMGMLPIHPAMYQQYQQQLMAAQSAAAAGHRATPNPSQRESPSLSHTPGSATGAQVPGAKPKFGTPSKTITPPTPSTKPTSSAFSQVDVKHKIPAGPDHSSGEVAKVANERKPAAHFCFVCGFLCDHGRYYILRSCPGKEEVETKRFKEPFFPFLVDRQPAGQADKMGENGTVKSCHYCYYTLQYQWVMYERAKEVENRYLRKYNVKTFVCFICAKHEKRNDMRTVDLRMYPDLVERKRPIGSLVMETECSVAVCVSCEGQLSQRHSGKIGLTPIPDAQSRNDYLQGRTRDATSKDPTSLETHSSAVSGLSGVQLRDLKKEVGEIMEHSAGNRMETTQVCRSRLQCIEA